MGLITSPEESPTECGLSECDREASIMRRPWPTSSVNDVWCTIFGGILKILVKIYKRLCIEFFLNILLLGLNAANCNKENFF